MVTFSVPDGNGFFNFSVETHSVLFAGSRYGVVPEEVCSDLISYFGTLGFSFMTGCANGVDEAFRKALSVSDYHTNSIVACAFKKKAEAFRGVYPLYVVPEGLPPRVALAKRTLWMTSRCSILILFPSFPIGKGSALAFKSAIMNNKPVFVVTDAKPKDSSLYTVLHSNLSGIVDGYWCVPPIYKETGLCYEAV